MNKINSSFYSGYKVRSSGAVVFIQRRSALEVAGSTVVALHNRIALTENQLNLRDS